MKGCDDASSKKVPLLLMMLGQIHFKLKILISKLLGLLDMCERGRKPIIVDMGSHSLLII